MSLAVGEIVKGITNVADDLIITKEELRQLSLKEMELDNELLKGQMAINQEEAKHKSVFVAGWRPFIGWVGGFALAWKFILNPLLNWILVVSGMDLPDSLPDIDSSELYPIILGMLGIGAMRSYDKTQGTSTESISTETRREARLRRRLEKLEGK